MGKGYEDNRGGQISRGKSAKEGEKKGRKKKER